MHLAIEPAELRAMISEVVSETLAALDFPAGRVALTEPEAAKSLGRPRHCLRDARLRGELQGSKAGKAWVYTRRDLMEWLDATRTGAPRR